MVLTMHGRCVRSTVCQTAAAGEQVDGAKLVVLAHSRDVMLYLVAVYVGGPCGWHSTLCNSALHLSSDIHQHLVHATTLANTKSLQDGQYALACLPAKASLLNHCIAK